MMNNTSPKSNNSFFRKIYLIFPWMVFILVFSGLIKLGFWQLSRAHQKTAALEQSEIKRNQQALSIDEVNKLGDKQYVPIVLNGKWLKTWSFYLDNRFQQGRSGYNTFSLFEDKSGSKIFVDRGWQAIGFDRKFNFLPANENQIQVKGYVYLPTVYNIVEVPKLSKNDVLPVPGMDMPQFIKTLAQDNKTLSPYIVRQTFPEVEMGLIRKWVIVGSPPERNLGYAVQWFLMAFALFLLVAFNTFKKYKRKQN